MTAEELITHLERLPPDTRVLVEGYENGYDEIAELRSLAVFRYKNAREWDGEYQTNEEFPGPENVETFSTVVIQGRRGHLRRTHDLQ